MDFAPPPMETDEALLDDMPRPIRSPLSPLHRHRSPSRSRSRSRSPRRRHSRSRSPIARRPMAYGGPKDRPAPKPSNVLGIFGLSLETRQRDLEDLFASYGDLERVTLVYDRRTGQSRGFAFAYFKSLPDAENALAKTNGINLHGRMIRVDFSATVRPHSPTPGKYMGSRDDRDRLPHRGSGERRYDDRRHYDDRRTVRRSSRSPPPPIRRYSRSRSPPPPIRREYDYRNGRENYRERDVGREYERPRDYDYRDMPRERRRSPSPLPR